MIPPSFSDIGKPANDLLGKDYPTVNKLEVSTVTPNGIKFTVNGSHDKAITSDLKSKYSKDGITWTSSISSFNVLSSQLELTKLVDGLKVDLSGSLNPEKGAKTVKTGFEFKTTGLFTRSYLDLFKSSVVSDVSLGHDGFVVGAEVGYDVADAKVTKYSAAAGYIAPLYSVSLLGTNKFTTFSASYYHKVSSQVEAGAKAVYTQGSENGVAMEVGTKYLVDSSAFVKAKIDNFGRLGLGLTQAFGSGFKLSIGGLFDTTRLSADVHKVGFSLTFEG